MGKPLFSMGEVAEATGGALQVVPRRPGVDGVSIDSRTASPGCLFVPVSGSRVDGHDFIDQALRAGCGAFLASRPVWSERGAGLADLARRHDAAVVVVADTLRALQALAAWHLRRLPAVHRIGITGSNGKTTTKELVGSVLATSSRVTTSPGNLNSETGLPLACFRVVEGTEIAVFELAMNHPGEIADLADIVRPNAALITNIGLAHIGFCGSQEAIAREKKAIFHNFTGEQVAFIPAQEPFSGFLAEGLKGRVVLYGQGATERYQGSEDRGLDGSIIHWEGLRIRLPLVGRHNVSNALAAIAVGVEMGVPPRRIQEALEQARAVHGRSEVLRGRVTVLADCYNASPDSVRELLGLLRSAPRRERRLGVFGSMLELGERSAAEHERLGEEAAGAGFDALWFFGAEARPAMESARRSAPGTPTRWLTDHEELARELREAVRDGDLVVLKGSRGVELERLIPALLPEVEVAPCS